jgi:hypothetical protein
MSKQGSMSVSHSPVYVNNVVIDYVRGLIVSLKWDFSGYSISIFGRFIFLGICISVLFTLFALVQKDKSLYSFVVAILVAWTIYFIAVACSFYGINKWAGTLGSYNIGGKYALFFIPIILVTLVCGTRITLMWLREKYNKIYKILLPICILGVVAFCGAEIIKLDVVNWEKDDIREVVEAWYDDGAYNSVTLVHQWDEAIFHFYLMHDENYDESYQNSVEVTGAWIKSVKYDEMNAKLKEMGYLDLLDFYYVAPANSFSESGQSFIEVMEANNFSVEIVYEGTSTLLHLTK